MSRDIFRYVYDAAKKIDDAMTRAMGTGTPTLREVKALAMAERIVLDPVFGDRAFKVELILDGPGMFRVRYNATQLPIIQMLQIYHEICEVMAVRHHPGLFDDDPQVTVYAFDGGANPKDMRHLAALDCEQMLMRRLNAAGYTVPRSVTDSMKERKAITRRRSGHESGRCRCGCDGSL